MVSEERRKVSMLELRHIKKSYDNVTILEDINLKIQDGEIVSILGPSGCGKTTLLNLVLGLTPADQGQILFDGKDITKVPMEERGFNIVFQDYALFPNLNVYKNITYGLRNKPDISTKEEVDEVIFWLTGYNKEELKDQIEKGVDLKTFFEEAPGINPNAALIKGVICGVRVEEIPDPLMQKIRYLDKLIDELAKGKPMEKILRK